MDITYWIAGKLSPQQILCHHDNAQIYSSAVVMEILMDLKFQFVRLRSYSPDWAHSDSKQKLNLLRSYYLKIRTKYYQKMALKCRVPCVSNGYSWFQSHLMFLFVLLLEEMYWYSNFTNLIWIRNHVVAPLSEEFTYRSCMLPLLLQSFSPTTAILINPLLFGVGKLIYWHFRRLIVCFGKKRRFNVSCWNRWSTL